MNPAQIGHACCLLVEKQRVVSCTERQRHAAQNTVSDGAEARESRARCSRDPQLGRVEPEADRRHCIRILVADEARAQMQQQRRLQCLVVVHPGRHAADVLYPDARQLIGKSVHAVRFVRVLRTPVARNLPVVAEVVVKLHRRNLLQFKESARLREIVHVTVAAQIRFRQIRQNLRRCRIDPARRDGVARKRVQYATPGRIQNLRGRIVNGVLNDRPPREVCSQIPVCCHRQIVAQISRQIRAVGNGGRPRIEAFAVAILLHVEEEERLALAVVNLR